MSSYFSESGQDECGLKQYSILTNVIFSRDYLSFFTFLLITTKANKNRRDERNNNEGKGENERKRNEDIKFFCNIYDIDAMTNRKWNILIRAKKTRFSQ